MERQISRENLHLSSFVVAKKKGPGDGEYSILLLRAGDKHPLSFRRGKLVLPALFLDYGEKPRDAARRALSRQLENPDSLEDPQFLGLQTWYTSHWDIVFLLETWVKSASKMPIAKQPYLEAVFYPSNDLPVKEISEDHLDVLKEMLHPSEATLSSSSGR
jgi:ADP-ribose pyrophosphatase YjhB (NUDIX family)